METVMLQVLCNYYRKTKVHQISAIQSSVT